MDKNNYCEKLVSQKDYAVVGLPMTILVMLIVTGVILSMYVLGSDYIISFHQEKQIKNVISNVCEKIMVMNSFSPTDSRITMTISFPSLVDTVMFGGESFDSSNNSNISYHSKCCVLVQLTSGKKEVIHCPIAFCDEQKRPLLFHSGTYQVSFSMERIDGEVFSIGTIEK